MAVADLQMPSIGNKNPIDVLLVCCEWGSSKGGLPTFNRHLAFNLAKTENIRVYCYLSEDCSETEKQSARDRGVNIIIAKPVLSNKDPFVVLYQKPPIKPDIVISHGRKFGPCAQVICDHFDNQCKWVNFLHVDCYELGKYKETPRPLSVNSEKNRDEVDLCKKADLNVAVGRSLEEKYKHELTTVNKNKITCITPGLDEDFRKLPQKSERTETFYVYIFGRESLEDFHVKGFDVAADAVAELGAPFKLHSFGAGTNLEAVREKFRETKIKDDQLTVHRFCSNREELKSIMCQADVVVMPSRAEAFGLIGLEALSAGVPVLVSACSGFGKALLSIAFGEVYVVETDSFKVWAKKIKALSSKTRALRNDQAKDIRENYDKAYRWDRECSNLAERFSRLFQKNTF